MSDTFGRVRLAVSVAVVLMAPGAVLSAQEEVGIGRGEVAPAVEIEDLDGNPFDLGDLLGSRPVLLEFWASWCEVCEALAPSMERAYEQYGDEVSFVIVAVGVGQSQRNVRRHVEEHPAGYQFLYDGRGRATRAYSAPTTSYVVIVDAEGKVAYTGVGGDQDLEAAVREVLGSAGAP